VIKDYVCRKGLKEETTKESAIKANPKTQRGGDAMKRSSEETRKLRRFTSKFLEVVTRHIGGGTKERKGEDN